MLVLLEAVKNSGSNNGHNYSPSQLSLFVLCCVTFPKQGRRLRFEFVYFIDDHDIDLH
jgi:hypothetical protein